MEQIDISLVTLIVVGIVGLLILISIFRRSKPDDSAMRSEVEELKATIRAQETELRGALKRADTGEALNEARSSEIEKLKGDLTRLQDKLDEASQERSELNAAISSQRTQMEAERKASEEKIKMLTELREDMAAKFREMADQALKLQGESFSKANLEKLDAALTPLKEHVGHFEKELKTVHQETVKDRERLKTEIQQLSKRSEEVSQEALALTRALKGDQQKQGAWGEMILESILERSGLREGEEYETQAHRTGTDGERLRPDVVVNIPGQKTLVIDSKVSLVAYTQAVNAGDEAEAAAARKRHVLSLKNHINGLSAKGYQQAEGSTVDYVILFVPIEGALSEALREDGTLTEYALDKHITIATPTTLMMALRTIASVWAVERRNQNAEEIARRAGLLYEKVAGFVGNMENVGKRLDQARGAYDTAFGQLSRGRGNLLSQVETLKTLGAKTGKTLGVDFDDAGDETRLVEQKESTIA